MQMCVQKIKLIISEVIQLHMFLIWGVVYKDVKIILFQPIFRVIKHRTFGISKTFFLPIKDGPFVGLFESGIRAGE